MAQITQRGNSWLVRIRKGKYKYNPIVKTFKKKSVAERWARDVETDIDRGNHVDHRLSRGIQLSELIQRYIDEILTTKAESTQKDEGFRLRLLLSEIGVLTLDQVTEERLYAYIIGMFSRITKQTEHYPESRQRRWSNTYVKKYMSDLQNVFKLSAKSWKIPLPYGDVAKSVRERLTTEGMFNGADKERIATLPDKEYLLIRRYKVPARGQPLYKLFVLFAFETGMRRSEILDMKVAQVNWSERFYYLERDKSTNTRTRSKPGREVPLTRRARAILRLVCWRRADGFVWPWRGKNRGRTVLGGVQRLYDAIGIPRQLAVHGLRHAFGSKYSGKGLDIRVVGAALGHSDLKSTKRYTHPEAGKIVDLLEN